MVDRRDDVHVQCTTSTAEVVILWHKKKEDFSFALYSSALARMWLALLYSPVLSRAVSGLSLLLPRVGIVRDKFSEDCLCHV